MPQHKGKFNNPLDQAAQTGIIGYVPEETPGEGKQENSGPPALQRSNISERGNARIPEFQNADSGTPEQTISSFAQNSRILERQPSSPSEFQNARTPTFKRSKPPAVPKTNADGWEQQTTYLPPDLRQWLRIYALSTNQEISEIIAIALQEYRMRQQRG